MAMASAAQGCPNGPCPRSDAERRQYRKEVTHRRGHIGTPPRGGGASRSPRRSIAAQAPQQKSTEFDGWCEARQRYVLVGRVDVAPIGANASEHGRGSQRLDEGLHHTSTG